MTPLSQDVQPGGKHAARRRPVIRALLFTTGERDVTSFDITLSEHGPGAKSGWDSLTEQLLRIP